MSSPLRFRAGSKFGVSFQVSPPATAEVIRKGKIVEGTVATWSRVGVRSILKDQWQDQSGRWRDSIYFYELEPAEHENRIECDEFFVSGPFAIALRETEALRAQAAWKAFSAR